MTTGAQKIYLISIWPGVLCFVSLSVHSIPARSTVNISHVAPSELYHYISPVGQNPKSAVDRIIIVMVKFPETEYLSFTILQAEVQSVYSDGSLSLHTRSLKYGKLGQGILVQVSPSLVKRRKTHFHNLPCGASIILGK
jgi:hypothetical protein